MRYRSAHSAGLMNTELVMHMKYLQSPVTSILRETGCPHLYRSVDQDARSSPGRPCLAHS